MVVVAACTPVLFLVTSVGLSDLGEIVTQDRKVLLVAPRFYGQPFWNFFCCLRALWRPIPVRPARPEVPRYFTRVYGPLTPRANPTVWPATAARQFLRNVQSTGV
jgi:hypothetical protein